MFFLDTTICQLIILFFFMNLFYLYAVREKRNDIADTAWGFGFIVLAIVGLIHNPDQKMILVFLIVSIWGIRLATNNYRKFRSAKGEDKRYSKWRDGWGESWRLGSWLKVFLLQYFMLLLVGSPILLVARYSSGEWSLINTIGVFIWLFGFIFEVIADNQLRQFIKTRKEDSGDRIMKQGLWKYTRHPNYFGEAVLWWGVFLITIGTPYYYLSIIGPITITILLRFVSGVPMAEERYRGNKEFETYKEKTPAFLPNFFIK